MEDNDIEKGRRKTVLAALEATAGSISADDHPEWSTPGKVAAWVRTLRYGRPLPNASEDFKDD